MAQRGRGLRRADAAAVRRGACGTMIPDVLPMSDIWAYVIVLSLSAVATTAIFAAYYLP